MEMTIRIFSLFLILFSGCAESTPDVNEARRLSPPNFEPQYNSVDPGSPRCPNLRGRENDCVEKINQLEYRPFVSIIEENYKVPVPEIRYVDVPDPQIREIDVNMPTVQNQKVPVVVVKEVPEIVSVTRIKEIEERVPVLTTDVVQIPKVIPNPIVRDELLKIPEIQKQPLRTKYVKNLRGRESVKVVDTFKVEPILRTIRRPIIERRPVQVNRTTVKYITKVVEVPKIITRKLRLPKPRIKQGATVYIEKSEIQPQYSEHFDEFPEPYDEFVDIDQVRREPKTIVIPYPEKTRVIRPVLIEAPIEIPEKQPVTIVRNQKVQGPQIPVPCGIPAENREYLPAPCPPCQAQACQQCQPCQMQGYSYPKPY